MGAILFLLAGVLFAIWRKKLTVPAALWGNVIGGTIYFSAGWTGLLLMTAFFAAGTLATTIGARKKEAEGISLPDERVRKTSQVFANAGVAFLCALLALVLPSFKEASVLMMAASFSSASADTLSSELGSLYGRRFFNILTFRRDRKGLDGVVSAEGFLFGLAGSVLIAIVYATGCGYSSDFLWIVLAGTVGNLVDSILGAWLERKNVIKNDAVNFLNTLAAALFILLFL